MSLILVAKKSGKQVELSKVVKNGKYTELAVPGEEYYVIDSETGKTPTDIEVSRSGDDLIIKSPSEDTTVIIDEFWHDCTPETQCYAIFDVPAVDGLEAGQVTVTQVGPDVSAFKPGMVGILPEDKVVAPWIWAGLGALLLGGLAAGSGGGGGGSSQPAKDTTAPEIKDGSLDVSGDGKQVTGKTEPGATVTVKDENGKTIGTATANQNGDFTIPLDTPKTNGETLTVTAQDQAGNTSVPETVKADDSTAPKAPTNLDVSDDGSSVSGKAEPGTTVTIRDENGNPIGEGKADQNGNFTIPVNPPKTNGEPLTAEATDGAGNTSPTAGVKADDSTAPAAPTNLDVSDDGSSVSGKAEPGATVTIRDENGNPIGEGKADQNGNFTIPVNPPKTNGEPLTAEATDGAGNTSPTAGVNADDNTAPTKPTLTNDSEDNKLVATEDKDITGSAPDAAGGTAVLVDGNGNPVKDSAGNPITAPIDDNGNFTLPAAGVPDGDYGVQVKDEAGNPSTGNAPISIDRTVPVITSVEFADNNNPSDNQLTRNEVGTDGKTWVNVNFDKTTVKVDDVIKVNGVDHKITEADITAGQAQVEIPVGVAPGSQGALKVSAQITDTAGNQSDTVDNSILVNRAVDGIPRVEYIDDGANGGSKDGTLTAAEITGDNTPTTTARIVLPDNLEDGDTVSIPDLSNTPYTVSGNKVGDYSIGTNTKGEKYIDVQVPVAEGATSLTTPVVVTVDGTELPATGNIKVDTVAPQEAPVLTVEGVTPPTDTTINAAEAKDGLDLKVTIPQGTQEGDHIIIKDGDTVLLDRPLTKEEAESDKINLNIEAPANGTTVTLTATVKEPREDGIAKTSDPVTATVDTAIPGGEDTNGDGFGDAAPVITFTQDTEPKDGKLNAAELDGQKAAVTIKVPTDVAINDTLVYTVNGGTEQTVNITAAVKENGFTVPADKLPETGTITVKAYVKDAAGNRSAEAEEAAKIDTSIGKPTPTAGEDGSVNITLPSDAEKGDTVKVEYTDEAGNPQTVTLTKGDDGWTSDKPELINHPTGNTATIPEDGVKDNTPVTITAKDTAGNTSSADPFKAPDVTAPSKPEFDEPQDDGSVKINLPTDANPGDQVKVTVTPEGATEPTTVTLEKQPDGTWESDKPEIINHPTGDTATISEDQVKDGSQVTAVATDGTNSSDPTTADATDTRTPMLSLTDQSADKVLGNGEGNSITGKVTYDSIEETADTAEGAKVILKNAQGEQVATTTAAADGTFTFASVTDGTYSIEVTSASGETGAPITDVLVDHLAPVAKDITLANDTAGASATDNISYDGTLVIPTLGDGESIKSVTANGVTVNPDPVTGKYVLNPGVYAAGSIEVVVQDKAGHETTSTNSEAITIDTTAPAQPTIDPQTNGSVNITLPSGENVKADDTVEVTYTDESGVKQTVTFTKGEEGWTSDKPTLIANPIGNTATIPAPSVQDGSEVTAVAKDPAGNASTATPQNAGNNPDTTAPSAPDLKPKADGTMDIGLPTDANPGDKVVVTVTPDGATQPEEVTLTKQPDGTWTSNKTDIIPNTTGDTATIPENQVKDGSEVTAIAKDDAGNTSAPTTKAANDTRKPVVDLTGQSDNNILDATEGKNITGTVTYDNTDANADKAEGAKVELLNAQGATVKETTADKDGNFTLENVDDGTYSIKVTSASGKPGTGVDKVVVDHTVPGDASSPLDGTSDQAPSVVFVDDKNPKDGVLTRNEVGSDNKVKVEVTLPTANVNEGDTVVLIINGDTNNPVTHTITAAEAQSQSHKATIEVPVGSVGATEKQNLIVAAKVVDAAGQSSKEGTSSIPVDRTVNGTPSIEYVEDTGSTVNGTLVGKEDGILWASENATDGKTGETTVKVHLPKGIGGEDSTDTVTITINGKTYTLSSDGDHVGENGAATYKIHRPSAADTFDPYVEIPVATTAISQIDAKVGVTYTKAGENTPTTVGTEDVILTIDSAVPGGDAANDNQGDTGPILAIDDADEDEVTGEELSDGKVVATVTLPEGVQAGDHIILKDANGNVLADVPVGDTTTAGTEVTFDIPKSKLPDGDYKVTAIVKEDGTNGRESAPSNEVSFKVDTDAPNAPELTVNNGGVDITLPGDAQKDDTVKVEYTKEDGTSGEVTLTKQEDGTWKSDKTDVIPSTTTTSPNTATLPANQVKDGTTVTATASDGVNPPASDTATVNDTRTPVITLTGQSADNQLVKTDGNTITGTVTYSDDDSDSAETATVTLVNKATGAETDPVTVGADGTFSFANVADGVYTVKATKGETPAESKTVTVDHKGPADAAITFANDTGTADDKISSDGTLNIAPATDATGIVDGSIEYSKDGETWTDVPVVNGKYVLPEDGTYSVRVTTEDNVGNTTTTKVDNFVVDKTPPTDATIKLTSDTGGSNTDNISKDGGLTITPASGATIQKVEYQDAAGWHTFDGTTYTLSEGTYAAGAIKVTTVDTAGNTKETFNTATIIVDQTPPKEGTVTIAKDTGTLGADGITNDGTLVTPTLGEGESIKSVTVKGEPLSPNADGKYILSAGTYAAEDIQVTVVDKAGNETVSKNGAAITVDTTPPAEPTVKPAKVDGDGSVTVGLPTDAKDGDKVEVKYTDENGDEQPVTLTKGENGWTPSADLPPNVTLNGNTLTIGEDAVKDGTPVNAKSIDVAGNEAEASPTAMAGSDALSTTPTVTVTDSKNGYVNKIAMETDGGLNGTTTYAPDGSTIKLLDKNGNPVNIGTVTVTGGTFTIPADKVPDGDYTITVTTPAEDGGKSASTGIFTVDTKVTAPSLSTTDDDGDGSVTVGLPDDAKVGDKVEVSVTPEGATQPETVILTKGETGWTSNKPAIIADTTGNIATILENAVEDGSTVTAKSVDTAGNEAEASPTATAGSDALAADPKVTVEEAADGYVNKAELANSGLTGTTENAPNGSKVELLDEQGTPVDIGTVTVTDGTFTIPADKVPNNGTYTIKVTTPEADGAKEVSTKTFTVDTAAPEITGHRFITNDANNDGTITYSELNGQTTVKYEVSFSGAVEGTKLLVAAYSIDGSATTGSSNVSVTLTAAQAADGKVTVEIPITATPDSTTKEGNIRVTRIALQDPARNSDSVTDQTDGVVDSLHIDMTPPSIELDPVVTDKGVNAAELANGISGTVNHLPTGTQQVQLYNEAGQKVGSPANVDQATGKFTIPNTNNVIVDGEKYTVKLVSDTAIESAEFTVDTTVHAPTVTASTENGNGGVTVALPTTDVKVGDKVKVTFTGENDQPVSITLTKDASGWTSSATLPDNVTLDGNTLTISEDAVKDGSKVNAKSVDTADNEAVADSATAGSDEPKPVITVDAAEIANGVNKEELSNGIPGTVENAPEGAKVQLYKGEEEIGEPITVGTGGAFSIPSDIADGDYTVKLVDRPDVTPATFTVDATPPATADITLANDAGDSAEDGISNDGGLILPELAEGETASIQYKDANDKWQTLETGSTSVPEGTYDPGDIKVTITDKAGNTSVSTNSKPITVDQTTPVPKVNAEYGMVTLPDNAEDGDKVIISYTDANGNPQTITVTKDSSDPAGWTITGADNAAVPPTILDDTVYLTDEENNYGLQASSAVTAYGVDKAGNTSDTVVGVAPRGEGDYVHLDSSVLDGINATELADGVKGVASGSTILYNPAGNQIGSGGPSLGIDLEGVADGDGFYVESGSALSPKFEIDTQIGTPIVKPSTTDGSVTVELPTTYTKTGDKVQITYFREGATTPTTSTVVKTDTGWVNEQSNSPIELNGDKVILPQDLVKDGSIVTATAIDKVGNTKAAEGIAGTDVPTITIAEASDGTVTAAELDNGGLTGTTTNAANGSTVQLLKGDSVVATTTVANNAFTFDKAKVPDGTYTVKVTTPAGTASTNEFVVDQTAPEADVTAKTDGSVEIALPANPVLNDKVTVTYTKEGESTETIATLTYNGSAWTSSDTNVEVSGNTATIAADKVADETTVTAAASDAAGNTQSPADTDTVKAAPVVATPSITMADEVTDGVNATELSDGISGTVNNAPADAKVQLYKGEEAIGDPITVGAGGAFTIPQGIADGDYTVKLVGYDDITADFTVDTTAPEAGVSAKENGSVEVALPTENLGDNDEVTISYTPTGATEPTTVIVTYDKDTGAWSLPENSGLTLANGTVTIPADKVADNTKVTAVGSDTAGNTQAVTDGVNSAVSAVTIQPWDIVFIGGDTSNDNQTINGSPYRTVLNQAEWSAAQNGGKMRIILPNDSSYVGKYVAIPWKAQYTAPGTTPITELSAKITQTDINNGYKELTASGMLDRLVDDQGEGGYSIPVEVQAVKNGDPIETHYYPLYVDKTPPTAPDVVNTTANNGTVTVTLPNDTSATSYKNATSATITIPQEGDTTQTVELVKGADGWAVAGGATLPDNVKLNGNTVTISGLANDTTVTAVTKDAVGNTATDTENAVNTAGMPMFIDSVSVTDENTGANGVQVVDNDVNFSYTLAGQLDADKEIRVRVVDANGSPVGDPQYITPKAGTTTGSIAVPAINGKDLKVVTDIVSKANHTVVEGSAKEAAFNLDNVHTVEVTSATNDSVTVDGQTFTFGAAAGSAGTENNSKVSSDDRTRVYNPKLDWEMRADDDTDNTSTGEYAPYHNDHADGWSYLGDKKYSWVGDDSRGDVITVAAVQTDEYYRRVLVEDPYTQTYRKGMIGGEEGQGAQFTLDTKGGGADYIQSEGIVGNVRISTNDGDDIISTKYLNGKYWASKGNFDGSEQIFMGDGNDTFKVTGTAASVGYNDVNDSSLYYTNAKVDMGSGNDTVNIAGRIFAGNQQESGNYFNLGAGNDTMTTGEISGEDGNWEGSTIINLGTGSDELTVNGNITSESNQTARFLLLSDDASKVTVNGSVYGKASMLMGDGKDTITITGDVNIKTPAISTGGTQGSVYWVQDVFSNNQDKGGLYTGFYDGISGDGGTTVNGKLADSATVAVDDSSNQMLASYITGTTDYRSLNQARFSLGDGDNRLEIQGNTTGANIVGGDNHDVVRLGDFADYDTSVSNTYVWTGAGDDQVLLLNPNGDQLNQVHVYGGKGNDDIQLYGVEGTYTEIHAGADNDTISLWGEVRSDNANIIDGGAGHDKVIIGNNGDDRMDYFVVGGSDSGHTQIWSMEEILFNSVNTGDQVKVYAAKLNDEHKLYIKGTSESTLHNQNKVDIEGAWSKQDSVTEGGVTYQHYTTTVDGTTEHLYIQNGISII